MCSPELNCSTKSPCCQIHRKISEEEEQEEEDEQEAAEKEASEKRGHHHSDSKGGMTVSHAGNMPTKQRLRLMSLIRSPVQMGNGTTAARLQPHTHSWSFQSSSSSSSGVITQQALLTHAPTEPPAKLAGWSLITHTQTHLR